MCVQPERRQVLFGFNQWRGPRKLAGFLAINGLSRYWDWGLGQEIPGFVPPLGPPGLIRWVWAAGVGSPTLAVGRRLPVGDGRPGSPGLG